MDELRASTLKAVGAQRRDYFRAVWGIDLMHLAEVLRQIEQGWGPVDPAPWKRLLQALVANGVLDQQRAYEVLRDAASGRATPLALTTLMLTSLDSRARAGTDGRPDRATAVIRGAAEAELDGALDHPAIVDLLVKAELLTPEQAIDVLT